VVVASLEVGALVSVFRELFVEVSGALLEAAVAEREDRERKKREAERLSRAARLSMDWPRAVQLLLEVAGVPWTLYSIDRDPFSAQTVVKTKLPCGHFGRTWLDELEFSMARSTREIWDYVYEEISRPPQRRCYCVQREVLKPCTPGECK